MCKQYHYETVCSVSSCDTVLGRRNRNRWCGEALKARRLGKCSTGVEVQETITETTRARCSKCKEEGLHPAPPPPRVRTKGKTDKSTSTTSANAGAPKPPRQRKPRSAPKKSNKRTLDEEEEGETGGKKRLKVETEISVDEASDASEERLEVASSPIVKVENANKRAFSDEEEEEEEGGPDKKRLKAEPPVEEVEPLVDEAKPANKKRSLSEEGEEEEEEEGPDKKRLKAEPPVEEVEPPVEETEPPVDEAKPANKKRSLSEEGEEPENKRPRVESPTYEAQEDLNVQDTAVSQDSSEDEGALPTPAPSLSTEESHP
ncbi:hypothetical protein F4775DRAFT_592686 [Biscogniauxia sp. FL1348]|nr:hypothetical protein F4775DRAFT_592686 [Biscogniauxia sp. FL1348]